MKEHATKKHALSTLPSTDVWRHLSLRESFTGETDDQTVSSLALAPQILWHAILSSTADYDAPASVPHSRKHMAGTCARGRALKLAESSTAEDERSPELARRIELLFHSAKEDVFEDGMKSQFSRRLEAIVRREGNQALAELSRRIVCESVSPEAVSEAMRWLGRMDHPGTYNMRRWILERALHCSSPRVRDGAALGLASMDDPHALPYLNAAIEREKIVSLRQDLEQVQAQLEAKACALHSPEGQKR